MFVVVVTETYHDGNSMAQLMEIKTGNWQKGKQWMV